MPAPTALISETIHQGTTITQAKIKIYFTGDIMFSITANGDNVSPTWEDITLISGVTYTHTFAVSGINVKYTILGLSGTIISTQKDSTGRIIAPGISIELI